MKKYIYICLIPLFICACHSSVTPDRIVERTPDIFPDYTEVTIPVTIAPLHFKPQGEYEKMEVKIKGSKSGEVISPAQKRMNIPVKKWQALLEENKGGKLELTVSIKDEKGWTQYDSFNIYISEYSIDYGLAYRLIAPGYEVYSKMGLYQRDLSGFNESAIIENTLISGGCVNCHSFPQTSPGRMSFHIRGTYGGTVLATENSLDIYHTQTDKTTGSCVYPYWHPSGRYIAYSVNNTRQTFHEIHHERVEVVDLESDLVVYDLENNKLIVPPVLNSKEAFETFPAFSPDGKSLYFCSAVARPIPEEFDRIRYDLCRIGFDPATGTFSEKIDTLVYAANEGKSVSFPRPSYDGRYIMYTLSDYGNFSIWHREADLWLLDLRTGESRPLTEVNSDHTESYHSWSSNSRWFVFSSRRYDGLYTQPYLASIDEQGNISKPFLLPQKDPDYYQNTLYSFNIPEFINEPVKIDIREVERKALSGQRVQFN